MVDRNEAVPDGLEGIERKMLVHDVMKDPEVGEYMREEDFDHSDFSEDEDTAHMELEEIFDPKNAVVVDNEDDWSKVLTQHREKGNTGGKGVLEDYKEATRITKRRNETKALQQREAWKKIGYNTNVAPLSNKAPSQKKKQEDDDDDDDSDDEYFKQFRAMRIQQLSSVANLPQFGRVIPVGKFQFLDEVDHADKRTFVVIHLYEDYILACQRMNNILDILADRYPHVKFCKLKATEADQTLSHSNLPGLMVYKNQELTNRASANVVRTELKSEKFTAEDVEWLLCAKYGVSLPGVDVTEKEKEQRNQQVESEQDLGLLGSTVVQRYD